MKPMLIALTALALLPGAAFAQQATDKVKTKSDSAPLTPEIVHIRGKGPHGTASAGLVRSAHARLTEAPDSALNLKRSANAERKRKPEQ